MIVNETDNSTDHYTVYNDGQAHTMKEAVKDFKLMK